MTHLPRSRNIVMALTLRQVQNEHPDWPVRLVVHVASKRLNNGGNK